MRTSRPVPRPWAMWSSDRASCVVPTRHGVQKPQLSWAKKCVKFVTTSSRSRSAPNTMKAPADGTSSNERRRENSCGASSVPDGPPTCTACTSCAPQASSTTCTGVPNGYSYSPGRSQSPDTEWMRVPLDCAVPTDVNQSPPCCATSDDSANVSTLLTTVGCCR
jgi:hypothetical protein